MMKDGVPFIIPPCMFDRHPPSRSGFRFMLRGAGETCYNYQLPIGGVLASMSEALLKDSYGRAIRDLRVSVTDRCNFRCFYCLPHGSPEETAPKEALLTY